jgi:hypothetical protein
MSERSRGPDVTWSLLKLAPHLPADPEKKTAGKHKSEYLQQLCCYTGAYDPKCGRDNNADYNGALSLLGWEPCGGKPYDDCIVSSQHQVDHDDLDQSRYGGTGYEIGHGYVERSTKEALDALAPRA